MYNYNCKILNIVDGDTLDAQIDVGFKMTTIQRVRILGINAPEMHSKDPVIKAQALAAKDYLISIALGKDAVITTTKADAFGRYLGDIDIAGLNISAEMLKQPGITIFK